MSTDRAGQYNNFTVISTWLKRLMNAVRDLLPGETARKGIVTLADQTVVSATNFLTGVIIGRACTKEEFGLYMLGFSIVLIVIDLQYSLISSPFTVYSPHLKGNDHAKYSGSTLIHQLSLSVLIILALAVTGFVFSLGIGPQGLATVVWTLFFVIMFIMLRDYARKFCFANMRMKTALLLDSCVAVVQIGGLLLFAHLGLLSARNAYWVVGIACSLPALIFIIRSREQFIIRIREVFSDFRKNWSLAKWLFATTLIYMSSIQVYPWLLAEFHGISVTGELAACMGVIFLANPFLIGLGNFIGPKTAHTYAKGGVEKVQHIVTKSTLFLAMTMGLFSILMLFFGGHIVVLFYGSKYVGNGLVVGILALSQFSSAITIPVNNGLLAIERPDVRFKSYLLALVITLTIGLWLVKSYGPIGVACGLLAGNVIASTFRYIVFKNQIRILSAREIRS